ncbi:hypothetical protein ACNKHK_27685 [Shigella flexneri]
MELGRPEQKPIRELFVLVGLPAAASLIDFCRSNLGCLFRERRRLLYQPVCCWPDAGRRCA